MVKEINSITVSRKTRTGYRLNRFSGYCLTSLLITSLTHFVRLIYHCQKTNVIRLHGVLGEGLNPHEMNLFLLKNMPKINGYPQNSKPPRSQKSMSLSEN